MKPDLPLYQAFGLKISSELKLPTVPLAEDQSARPEVTIRIGPVNRKGLKKPAMDEGWYQASPMQFWLHIDDTAWYMVTDGNNIVIDPKEDSDERSIRLFLLGSCMGVILHQRQFLVIHGNAIRFGNRCVVFAGPSGIGKSTLAAAFHQRGYEILADDVCAIDADGNAVPSFPQIKLWQDAATRLRIDTTDLDTIDTQVEKFAYPLRQLCQASLPVAAIYILTSSSSHEFSTEAIEGMNKFVALADNTYRMEYLHGLGLQAEHLQQCSRLAARIHLARISRPKHGYKLNELMDFILADLMSRGLI